MRVFSSKSLRRHRLILSEFGYLGLGTESLYANINLQAIESLSVYPTNLLTTQLPIVAQDHPTLDQGHPYAGQAQQ